jgi:hypothetical protein
LNDDEDEEEEEDKELMKHIARSCIGNTYININIK